MTAAIRFSRLIGVVGRSIQVIGGAAQQFVGRHSRLAFGLPVGIALVRPAGRHRGWSDAIDGIGGGLLCPMSVRRRRGVAGKSNPRPQIAKRPGDEGAARRPRSTRRQSITIPADVQANPAGMPNAVAEGHWARLLAEVSYDLDLERLMMDASLVKEHQHGAGARGGNQAVGRTKGC